MLKTILSIVVCCQVQITLPKKNDPPPIGPREKIADDGSTFHYFTPKDIGPLDKKAVFVVVELRARKEARVRLATTEFQFIVRNVDLRDIKEDMSVTFTGRFKVGEPELSRGVPLFVLAQLGSGQTLPVKAK